MSGPYTPGLVRTDPREVPGASSLAPGTGDAAPASRPGTTDQGLGTARVFLTDFGLAKTVATGSKLTRTGEALGTPAYMSPEQARGEVHTLTPATDVWSLGCVLYEMLAGRPAFGDSTGGVPMPAAAIVGNVLLAEPTRIRALRPDVPGPLQRLLGVAMAKRARARYADARALCEDLGRILRGERPRARPPAPRLRRATAVAVPALLMAGLAAVLSSGSPRTAVGPPLQEASPADRCVTEALRVRGSDPGRALALLREALALDPARAEARIESGLLLWASGRGPEARAEWSRVPDLSPRAPAARLYRGLEAFFRCEGGELRFDLGKPDLEALAGGEGREARVARGASRVSRRDWGGAREALSGVPGWDAALLRATVEGQDPAGDRAAAVREYTKALTDGIPFAWAYVNRGQARAGVGDVSGAKEDYGKALALDPRFVAALVNRASLRRESGDPAGGGEDATAALRVQPGHAEALLERAASRYALRDLRGALEDYDALVAISPGRADAHSSRGAVRRSLGDLEGAIEDYGEAIRLQPDYGRAYYNRAILREQRGDARGAIEDYGETLRHLPGCEDALVNRAKLRSALGDPAGAVEDLTEALRSDPEDAEALSDRSSARLALADAAGAEADASAALRIEPSSMAALVNRAVARRKLGKLGEAARDLEAALRLRPDSAEAYANLGSLRWDQGDWTGAAAAYAEFLRLAPNHPGAAEIARWIEKCRLKAEEARDLDR